MIINIHTFNMMHMIFIIEPYTVYSKLNYIVCFCGSEQMRRSF